MHPLGVLPGKKDLRGRAGVHSHLGADRDGVAQTGRSFRSGNAAERPSGLRDTIPVGSQVTMHAGSAAQILLAWEDPERMHRGLQEAAFSATALAGIRRRGWAQS